MFSVLTNKKVITENENNYFRSNSKNITTLGKLFLLPKIHKIICKVLGRPVIFNRGTLTEKNSKFLDHHLQSIMKQGDFSEICKTQEVLLVKLKATEVLTRGI